MGGRDREVRCLRPIGEKFMRHHLNQYKEALASCICYFTYAGSINRKIMVQASPGINVRPYLRNNQSKKA
jgi:hypothetical protein